MVWELSAPSLCYWQRCCLFSHINSAERRKKLIMNGKNQKRRLIFVLCVAGLTIQILLSGCTIRLNGDFVMFICRFSLTMKKIRRKQSDRLTRTTLFIRNVYKKTARFGGLLFFYLAVSVTVSAASVCCAAVGILARRRRRLSRLASLSSFCSVPRFSCPFSSFAR